MARVSTSRPEPGTRILFRWRKWDGSPHWEHECVYLGADEWGDWVGQPTGWRSTRPGRSLVAEGPNVTLIPLSGDHAATILRDHPRQMRIYIDIAWDVGWSDDPLLVLGIDMDLDVVRADDGRGVWIDDRDEWEEHRATLGYPAEVVRTLEALALRLEAEVRAAQPPFDAATGDAWLDRLEALGLDR